METVVLIILIVIVFAAFVYALYRWGELANDSIPCELNARDRYNATAQLEEQIRNDQQIFMQP